MDSRVIVLDVIANLQSPDVKSDSYLKFGERCLPDPEKLIKTPVILDFSVLSSRHNYGNGWGRTLNSYFDSLDKSRIRKRHCAIWNPEIGTSGAWDIEGVKLVHAGDSAATCHSTKFGTFAIIAEIEDEPSVDEDEMWLLVTKYVGYTISLILLVVFIVVVLVSRYLWDMFHLFILNLAIAMLLGHTFMLATESEKVRDDRDLCCFIGSTMAFFYLGVASITVFSVFALFRAMISGMLTQISCPFIKDDLKMCFSHCRGDWGKNKDLLMLVMGYPIHSSGLQHVHELG